MPLIVCLAIRNTADWEHGMEQDLGSYSFFSASLYTAKQTAGTVFMLFQVFQIFFILREVRVLTLFQTQNVFLK